MHPRFWHSSTSDQDLFLYAAKANRVSSILQRCGRSHACPATGPPLTTEHQLGPRRPRLYPAGTSRPIGQRRPCLPTPRNSIGLHRGSIPVPADLPRGPGVSYRQIPPISVLVRLHLSVIQTTCTSLGGKPIGHGAIPGRLNSRGSRMRGVSVISLVRQWGDITHRFVEFGSTASRLRGKHSREGGEVKVALRGADVR